MLNRESIEAITNYIENNYLTIEQLANQASISLDQLEQLISNACIPKHSHTITRKIVFHTDIFGDSDFTKQNIFYYHPSLIKMAIKANQYLENSNFIDTANKMKADFTRELYQALVEIDDAKQVFNECFDKDENLLANGIEKIMAEHWPYVMDGTYGVCLKEISAKNLILKNIAVFILQEWLSDDNHKKHYSYEKILNAANLYDKVAANFAPHEIIKSTRNRLFNKFKNYSQW
jgi:hypothetical protein